MELIALVFDIKHYTDMYCKGCVLDFQGGLKNYLENHFSECAAPNAEFINNPELLYSIKGNKQECRLNEWLQPITEESFFKTFTAYIKALVGDKGNTTEKLEPFKKNLKEIAKYSPHELEKLLTSSTEVPLQSYIINALTSNLNYKLEEKTIDYIELHKDVTLKSAVTILINHITHHAGSAKHAEFLVDLITKPEFDKNLREITLTKFINESKDIKDGQVFSSFEKTLSFDKQDNKLLLALAHASKNTDYVPSQSYLTYFEKLLDYGNADIDKQTLGIAAISKALQSILMSTGIGKDHILVEQKLNLLLSKVGKIPTSLISTLLDAYKQDQNYFTNTILDIVATDKGLSKEILGKLLEPITKLKDVKAALFMGLRLVQNHIKLPQDVLSYLKGFSEHKDLSIKLMAVKLFDQLKHGTPDADARFGMDLEKLGWTSEALKELFINVDHTDWPLLKAAIEKINDYKVQTDDFDRNGQTALDILKNKKPAEWRAAISRLINDNHYFIAKDVEQLLAEIKELNVDSKLVLKLVEDGWFFDQLNKIEEVKSNITNWQKEDFTKWRQSIKSVSDDNIAEVMAVLSQGIHNTVLENKYYPRPIQILSVLALFKSNNGGLAQIATGEGKSIIVGMFAAIQVFLDLTVDIITSSPDLAMRDHKYLQDFYAQFGITSDHNIAGGTSGKACYKANIVYGDMLHFIADTLKDITENTKHGRDYGVVIVDEVDNMFIDQNNMKVQLSGFLPGFEILKQILTYIWGESTILAGKLEQRDDKNCYTVPLMVNQSLSEEFGIANITNNVTNITSYRIAENCNEYAKEVLANFTTQFLMNTEQNRTDWAVVTPKHLGNFTRDQLPAWLESLVTSYNYYDDFNYIVIIPPTNIIDTNNTQIAAPFDPNNGAIQYGLRLADGLHQFIELKHALILNSESLISVFMSYFGYLSKYKGSIYGVTGTLGNADHHKFLNQVYGTDIITMPTFVHKDLTRFTDLILNNRQEWQETIVKLVADKVGTDRAGLIIVDSVAEVHAMTKLLIDSGINSSKIFKYGVGARNEAALVERGLDSGEILIATNAGGRGMDLKLSAEVLKHGGVHVIVTSFPPSIRIKDQAEGRGARNGEPGSTQFVIHMDQFSDTKCEADVNCLYIERDAKEAQKLLEDKLCKLPEISLRDELFYKYIDLVRWVNTPTGYNLNLSKPELNEIINATLYLYKENASTYLQVVKPDYSWFTQDITQALKTTELTVNKHINSILDRDGSGVSSLNHPDYEMVHFLIAKQPGLSTYPVIYERVINNFEKAVTKGVPLEWQEREPAKYSSNREINYLTWLLYTDGNYTDLKAAIVPNDTKIDQDILDSVKDRKQYQLWLADRALYSNEAEIKQITEDWAIWLKKLVHLFKQYGSCSITTEQAKEDTLKIQVTTKKKLFEEFELFKNEIALQARAGLLMKNPTYLVQKASQYIKIHYEQEGASSTYHEDSAPVPTWFKIITTVKDTIIYYASAFIPFDNYNIPNPLGQAAAFLDNATKLDQVYTWTAPNFASYMPIFIEGWKITDADQKDDAARIKMQFGKSASEAIMRLQEGFISPLVTQVGYLLSRGSTDYNDELFVYLVGNIRVFQKIVEAIRNNIITLEKSTDKQMVYIKDTITLEQLTSDINITQSIIDLVNQSGTINQIALQSIKNITSSLGFPGLSMINKEITASGGMILELGIYDLYEEKNWMGTILSAVLGVGQIFLGMALISMGGVFATSLGVSLIAQGAGDIISAGVHFAKDVPLDFGNYLNSKGMSLGIAIATAGTLHCLSSLDALKGIQIIDGIGKTIGETAQETSKSFAASQALFVSKIAGASALGSLFGAALYNGAKPLVDRDEIASKAAKEAEMLAHEHEAALVRIMTADALHNSNLMESLKSKISTSANHYLNRFNEDATKFGVGYAGSMVGSVMGGVGSIAGFGVGAAFQAGTTVAFGTLKNLRAMDEIVHKIRQHIKEASIAAGELPPEALAMKYDLSEFKSSVISVLTGSVVHIQQQEIVKPLSDNIGNFVSGKVIDYITKMRAAGEQVSQESYDDDHSIKHKQKADNRENNRPKSNGAKPSGNCPGDGAEVCSAQAPGKQSGTKHSSRYVVKPGDTLSKLEEQTGIKVADWLKANPQIKNPNLIFTGNELNVPNRGTSQVPTPNTANSIPEEYGPPKPPNNKAYTPTSSGKSSGNCPGDGAGVCNKPTGTSFYDEPIGPEISKEEMNRYGKAADKYLMGKVMETANGETPFEGLGLVKTVYGLGLEMLGEAVKELRENYPNVAKTEDIILDIINKPVEYVGKQAGEAYKAGREELINSVRDNYGEEAASWFKNKINNGEHAIASGISKVAPSQNQGEVLKVLEFIGLGKILKDGFKWAKDYKGFGENKFESKTQPTAKTHTDTENLKAKNLELHEKFQVKGFEWADEYNNWLKTVDASKVEKHHVFSDKNSRIAGAKLFKEGLLDPKILKNPENIMPLPTEPGLHPTMNTHKGRHTNTHTDNMLNELNKIFSAYKNNIITKDQIESRYWQAVKAEKISLYYGRSKL